MGKYRARVRWQVGIILVITVIWFAPLVWFNFQLVRHGRPLLTVAYVACALLSVSVIWLPEGYFRPRALERAVGSTALGRSLLPAIHAAGRLLQSCPTQRRPRPPCDHGPRFGQLI